MDARDGVTVGDQAIADHLRKKQQQKKVYMVYNKIDGIDASTAMADFIHWRWRPYGIAAHGRGVEQLLESRFKPLAEDYPDVIVRNDEAPEDLDHDEIDYDALLLKLAIVGRPNVGKSTLTNRILGEERWWFDMPGTTRDSVYIPMQRDEREYVLIDTAGVRRRGRIDEAIEIFGGENVAGDRSQRCTDCH